MSTTVEAQTVTRSGMESLYPLSGVVFIVLFTLGSLLIGAFEFLPVPEDARSFYEDSPSRIFAGGYILSVSGFFILWFAGSVRDSLSSTSADQGPLPSIAFGGGVAAGALVVFGSIATLVGAARGGSDTGIGLDAAVVYYDLAAAMIGSGVTIAMAVLIGSASAVALRAELYNRWLAWAGVLLAVGLLTPVSWAVMAGIIPWIVLVSVLLFVRGRNTRVAV